MGHISCFQVCSVEKNSIRVAFLGQGKKVSYFISTKFQTIVVGCNLLNSKQVKSFIKRLQTISSFNGHFRVRSFAEKSSGETNDHKFKSVPTPNEQV